MGRTDRLFEIIQILRSESKSITAQTLAERLEVSVRTVYRDIQTLQAMRTPIDGEPGVGYMLRQGYDLPPINFSDPEIEAILVGLSLLRRTGDAALLKSADRVLNKISRVRERLDSLAVSNWSPQKALVVDPTDLRQAIRHEQKVRLSYRDDAGQITQRTILPLSITYYIEVIVMAGWCELRQDFRHFRLDRIEHMKLLETHFRSKGGLLRQQLNQLKEQ